MNVNQVVNMLVRMVIRRLARRGMNAGFKAMDKRNDKADQAQGRKKDPNSADAAKRARQTARLMRRMRK